MTGAGGRLRGTTWDHPRGLAPLLALADDPRLGTPVDWRARTLREFGDVPVSRLADDHDLLVIDHPHVGEAAAEGLLHPLDGLVEATVLDELERSAVGPSWRSYLVGGRPYALPLDAACHVSVARADLLPSAVPRTWPEVLALAASTRDDGGARVALPLVPTDAWCLLLTLLASAGAHPFESDAAVAGRRHVLDALELLVALRRLVHPDSPGMNPIDVHERMTSTDEICYTPALFGYVTYAGLPGPRGLTFGAVPGSATGRPSRPLLGGAGLAVSTRSTRPREAAAVAVALCSGPVQRGAYAEAGGQPAHRSAWTDVRCDRRAGGFFSATLATMDAAYVRPRVPGFTGYQERAGHLVVELLDGGSTAEAVADVLDAGWRELRRAAA